MDQIIVSGLKIFAHHGVLPEEKKNGQLFILDIELELPLDEAAATDDLSRTVNYDEVCRLAGDAMTGETFDLIERAAQAVIDRLLAEFPSVHAVTVTLKKPEAPLCREVEYAAVRLRRTRE